MEFVNQCTDTASGPARTSASTAMGPPDPSTARHAKSVIFRFSVGLPACQNGVLDHHPDVEIPLFRVFTPLGGVPDAHFDLPGVP